MFNHEFAFGALENDLEKAKELRACLEQLATREVDSKNKEVASKLGPWVSLSYLKADFTFVCPEELWKMDFAKLMDDLRKDALDSSTQEVKALTLTDLEAEALFIQAMGVIYALLFYDRLKTASDLASILSNKSLYHRPAFRESLDYLQSLIEVKRRLLPNGLQKIAALLDLTAVSCQQMESRGQWRIGLWHKAYGTKLAQSMLMQQVETSTSDIANSNISAFIQGTQIQIEDLNYQARYYDWTELREVLGQEVAVHLHRLEEPESLLDFKAQRLAEWAVDQWTGYLKDRIRNKEAQGLFKEAFEASKQLIELYEGGNGYEFCSTGF